MANPIRRIIQLVLDKASAMKAEADAKKALSGIEGGFDRMRSAVARLAAGIGAALGGAALIAFGKRAVEAAAKVEQVWNDLRGTINSAGGSFEKLEGKIRATAEAFQDATVNDGEDFAEGLSRMITLTGNVEGSLKNMGLAANVAAQFFKGDLASGVELVAKVSQGNVTMLQKMGIAATSAANGLDVLAQRSMGAAERQTKTFTGQLRQLNNEWGDFKEELGAALIAADGQTSAMSVLREAVRDLTTWVVENKDAIRDWVANGLTIAIKGIKALSESVIEFLQLRGQMSMTAGSKPMKLSDNLLGLGAQLKSLDRQRVQAAKEQADILAKMEKAKLGFIATPWEVKKLLELNGQLQSANDQLELIDDNAERVKQALKDLANPKDGPVDLFGGAPVVIREKADEGGEKKKKEAEEEIDPVTESMSRFSASMRIADGMFQLLGKDFDIVGAQSSALQSHLEELIAAGLSPLNPYVLEVRAQLEALSETETKVGEVTEQLAASMGTIATQKAALGEGFDELGAQASALESAITSLAQMGFQASDPLMADYIDQLKKVKGAMKESEEQAANYGIAVSNVQSLIVGAVGGSLKEVAKAKAKENLLLAAEETAHGIVSLLNPFTAGAAPGHFQSAAKFGAIAVAWGGLSASIGGGVSGGGGSSLGAARGASGGASTAAQEPKQEVNIFLDSPGFAATNPVVQKVVYGAMQEARETIGNNVNVRVLETPRR